MAGDRQLLHRLGQTGIAFFGRFDSLREIQRRSITPVLSGGNVLLCSATASGKTEAVFAPLVARLIAQGNRKPGTVKVLAISPTRALVNDLHARLEIPLQAIGWSCGRQTSDHRDKSRTPDVLITTPESFDSMLTRDGVRREGKPVGHLLAAVEAVFLDEVHTLEASARGDQVVWLLERLRRLRKLAALEAWAEGGSFQVCAASATVPEPEALASKLLGPGATVVNVPGKREISIYTGDGLRAWRNLDEFDLAQDLFDAIPRTQGVADTQGIISHIRSALKQGKDTPCRKGLVFVPSRSLVDHLASALSTALPEWRTVSVQAHHGSLERSKREAAENEFSRARDAILVATSTMEVGVDIGDVDIVVLVGPPPDTSSFLQRIGRAGRRSGQVRVLPIARSALEARSMANILLCGARGDLDMHPSGRRWSVFYQQAASWTMQNRPRGRRKSDLLELAAAVWPETGTSLTAEIILEHLVESGDFILQGDRLFLGDRLSDAFVQAGGAMHHNFDSGGISIPVTDAFTGEVVAHVMGGPEAGDTVSIGGRTGKLVEADGSYQVSFGDSRSQGATFRYTMRGAPNTRAAAEHVRQGLALESGLTPAIRLGESYIWFHFGGDSYELLLRVLLPDLYPLKHLHGIALTGMPPQGFLSRVAQDVGSFTRLIGENAGRLAPHFDLGCHQGKLPKHVRQAVLLQFCAPQDFANWLGSREVRLVREDDPVWAKLAEVAGA